MYMMFQAPAFKGPVDQILWARAMASCMQAGASGAAAAEDAACACLLRSTSVVCVVARASAFGLLLAVLRVCACAIFRFDTDGSLGKSKSGFLHDNS